MYIIAYLNPMKKFIFVIILFSSASLHAKDRSPESGYFSLGLRQTVSLFGHSGYPGYGSGGQFRIRLGERLNTEWFADYLTTPYGDSGKRIDGHIGWSVMFYPFSTAGKKFVPYIIAGHCFDYTRITPFNTLNESRAGEAQSRWSSATQAGIGVHYNLSDRFDLTFKSQYMIHLGEEIHAEVIEQNGTEYLLMDHHSHGGTLEGHLLLTLSLNYRIADLW